MAITPWTVGNTASAWIISLIPDTGYVNVTNLTTSNFSLRIRNNNLGTETTGQGTFSNITAAVTSGSGINLIVISHASVTYQPVAADVNTLGMYTLWVDVTFSNGVQSFLIGLWQIVAE